MKKKIIASGVFGTLFIWLAVFLRIFDVAAIGPEGSKIGFSTINKAVFEFFGTNNTWDKITDILIAIAILGAASFAVLGCSQWAKHKKLAKADKEIRALGGLYVAMGVLYVLFEKIVVVNCRPVLEDDGTLESSFPSTHTLISCVVLWSAVILIGKYIKNKTVANILRVIAIVLSLAISIGRLAAGKHWLTDVCGGYLLSACLVFAFWAVISSFQKIDKKN